MPENGLWVEYEECFEDEATISMLYELREDSGKVYLLYKNGHGKYISLEEAVKWILEKYANEKSTAEELKEEKMYILYLMGINVTKIGEYFGVSRQTVHKKIKSFESNRLQQFLPHY